MRKVALWGLFALLTACASQRVPANSSEPAVPPPGAEEDELAQQAYRVLLDNCWGCHGQPGKEAFGETAPLDWILDYDKLIETMTVVPGNAGKSRLIYIVAVEGKMPREFDKDGMPSIEGELAEEDLQTLIAWVKAGAPRWKDDS